MAITFEQIREAVNAAFRDSVVEGVPSSGAHNPVKQEIRDALALMIIALDDGGFSPPPDWAADLADVVSQLEQIDAAIVETTQLVADSQEQLDQSLALYGSLAEVQAASAAATDALEQILEVASGAPDAPSILNKIDKDAGNMTAPEKAALLSTLGGLPKSGVGAESTFLDSIQGITFIVSGSGGLGASLSSRFRYDTSLASFGYPVDDASDVTPALNAAMASGRDVYIPYVPGGLKMATAPTVPSTRFSLHGDESRTKLVKQFAGGAAFEFRGSDQSVKGLEVDFTGLSIANAGWLFDLRTDLSSMELTVGENIIAKGCVGLIRDRPSASFVSVLSRLTRVFGRNHRGVGGAVSRHYAFLEWESVVVDYVLSPTLDRSNMIVWDITGNAGGYAEKLEVSNVPRSEDAGMVGIRIRNTDALIFRQGLLDGIAGDGYLLDGGCNNLKFYETRTSITSGSSMKMRNGAGSGNINIGLYGHNGTGRNNVAGGYSPAVQHGLDVQSTQELDLAACRFQQFTGSGLKAQSMTELNAGNIKCRANTRYGLEFGASVNGVISGGSTLSNGLGNYLLPGAGNSTAALHGRNILGNSGALYDFDGVS